MIIRQPKRWCDECKLMVFSRGHKHGQVQELPRLIRVGYEMATRSAEAECECGTCIERHRTDTMGNVKHSE